MQNINESKSIKFPEYSISQLKRMSVSQLEDTFYSTIISVWNTLPLRSCAREIIDSTCIYGEELNQMGKDALSNTIRKAMQVILFDKPLKKRLLEINGDPAKNIKGELDTLNDKLYAYEETGMTSQEQLEYESLKQRIKKLEQETKDLHQLYIRHDLQIEKLDEIKTNNPKGYRQAKHDAYIVCIQKLYASVNLAAAKMGINLTR